MAHKPRFSECRDCVFFSLKGPRAPCIRCPSGENFQERHDVPDEPSKEELMSIYARMTKDEND